MDSLRKKTSSVPKPIIEPEQIAPQREPMYSLPKKEDLYIPKEETTSDYHHEKIFRRGLKIRKIIWSVFILIISLLILLGIFFAWKTYAVSKKINDSSATKTTLAQDMKSLISPIIPNSDPHTLRGEDSGRINILLLGAAGEKKPGGNLTDTIMVMSIDTKNKKVAMLSLPRDLYIQVPEANSFVKINSLYKIGMSNNIGADLIKQSVEKITNIPINYYLTVDFDAFQQIIDDIGGVNIISERDILDARYPGPNYSYETFALAKGAHMLNGSVALKYVRERHDDPEGDFGRAKRQQQVIQAVKNKLFSVQTLFNVERMSDVLDTLGDNVKTDMSLGDIEQFIKLSKAVDTQNINNVVVDAWKPDSLLKVSHVMFGNVQAFILVPRIGNYSEIQDLAQNVFNQDEIKKRQAQIADESASIAIINNSNDKQLAAKTKKLLTEKLGLKNVRIIPNTNNENKDTTTISVSNNSDSEKLFTSDELIKKLPASLDDQKTDSADDITITLGNDLIETYKYEEDSIDDFKKAEDSQDNIDLSNPSN